MDIITGQSVIIEQLTPGRKKLMGTDIASVFMVTIQMLYNYSWDSTWRPPPGDSVGCTSTLTLLPIGCAVIP